MFAWEPKFSDLYYWVSYAPGILDCQEMCIKVSETAKYVVTFNSVLCINICTQNLSLYLISEMKWYTVFILTHIEKHNWDFSYLRRLWKMLHIFDWWYIFPSSHDCGCGMQNGKSAQNTLVEQGEGARAVNPPPLACRWLVCP